MTDSGHPLEGSHSPLIARHDLRCPRDFPVEWGKTTTKIVLTAAEHAARRVHRMLEPYEAQSLQKPPLGLLLVLQS